MPTTFTTDLPDEDQPVLGNGVEDEVSVDRETQVTDYGDVRIQIREVGASSWSTSAAGFAETVLDHATLTTTFGSREDGEAYEVRARTETEHRTGAWTTPVSITTILPGVQNLAVSATGATSVSLTWNEAADNEDGFRVYQRAEQDPTDLDTLNFGAWSQVQDLGPNTQSTTVTGLDDNRDYQFEVQIYTEDRAARTSAVQTTTTIDYSTRWTGVIVRPDGEKRKVDGSHFTDLNVVKPHTAMADAAVTFPWAPDFWDIYVTSTNEIRLYYGGNLLFRGYLEGSRSNDRQGTTELTGRGIARDLKDQFITATYSAAPVEDVISDLWSKTDFDATVNPPAANTLAQDQTVQDASSQSDFQAITSFADDVPLVVTGSGTVEQTQTVFLSEGEDGNTNAGIFGASRLSGNGPTSGNGAAANLNNSVDYTEFTFTPQHRIPESAVEIQVRYETGSGGSAEMDITLNGSTWKGINNTGASISLGWRDLGDSSTGGVNNGYSGGDLEAGQTYTLRLENTTSGENHIDVMTVVDGRYSHTFDNTTSSGTDGGQYLDGPELYAPGVQAEFAVEDRPENIEAVDIATSWDDTSGQQALAGSNDGGSSYPLTASNTTTLDQSFGSSQVGTQLRGRATIDRYGSRSNTTPLQGYQTQSLQSWTLKFDGSDRPVIDQQTFDDDALTVIQKAHRRGDYRFTVDHAATSGGTPDKVVESYQRGTQTRTLDINILARNPSKDMKGYANRVQVRGGERDDGTVPQATAENQTEITSLGGDPVGVRAINLKRPDLTTEAEVKSEARTILSERLTKRDRTGSIETLPTDALPGYDYSVDWTRDGSTEQSTSERVVITESDGSYVGRLEFKRPAGTRPELIEARFERSTTKDSL